jgi:hypothetical protein
LVNGKASSREFEILCILIPKSNYHWLGRTAGKFPTRLEGRQENFLFTWREGRKISYSLGGKAGKFPTRLEGRQEKFLFTWREGRKISYSLGRTSGKIPCSLAKINVIKNPPKCYIGKTQSVVEPPPISKQNQCGSSHFL